MKCLSAAEGGAAWHGDCAISPDGGPPRQHPLSGFEVRFLVSGPAA